MNSSPTARGFDALAPNYDEAFGANPVGQWMRQRTWQRMDCSFTPGSHILEVGCGTGIDLVRLASRGHRVTAIDISPAMASTARTKAAEAGLLSRVEVLCGDLSSGPVPELLARQAPYEGLLSNFGALNCVEDLARLAGRLHGLLKPGAPFIACLMTRPCPWEVAWFLLTLRPGKAFRRHLHNGIDVFIDNNAVRTFYDSADGYARVFSDHFEVNRSMALGVTVPPPYLEMLARRMPWFFRLTTATENRLAHIRPFSRAGDHTLIEMTAREHKP